MMLLIKSLKKVLWGENKIVSLPFRNEIRTNFNKQNIKKKKMTKRTFNLRDFIKVIVAAISLTGVTKVVAQSDVQFPSPQNFQMRLNYIRMDDWGVCAGASVSGPYHCTDFRWEEPNLSETESQIIGYRIYNYFSMEHLTEIPFSEGQIIAQTVSIGLEIGSGFEGYTWVTALYAEPDGESAPSNVEINLEGLPLVINKNEMKTHSIVYNNQMKTIEIIGIENITSIDIFGIDGRFITASELNNIDVKYLTNGIYVIKISTETGKIISDKLIIK
jgi:hypothetical protein